MNKPGNENASQQKAASRKKFLQKFGVLSLFAAVAASVRLPAPFKKNIIACEPDHKSTKIKMLTQDGTLVEIDAALLTGTTKKITNSELKNWVKK